MSPSTQVTLYLFWLHSELGYRLILLSCSSKGFFPHFLSAPLLSNTVHESHAHHQPWHHFLKLSTLLKSSIFSHCKISVCPWHILSTSQLPIQRTTDYSMRASTQLLPSRDNMGVVGERHSLYCFVRCLYCYLIMFIFLQ